LTQKENLARHGVFGEKLTVFAGDPGRTFSKTIFANFEAPANRSAERMAGH
jgi:hypothetical protein